MHPSGRSTLILLLLWAAATAIDLDKAFHIDDTFYLKAAQWIEHHPLHPMSGAVNWGHDPEPMHHFNQPPGFFYLVAATGHLFGYGELPMHAMRSLFTLLALFSFHGLARSIAPRQALWLSALFALCPAFLVNQGLMTDMPVMALQLLFFRLLLVPGHLPSGARLAGAALALSAAMFIKYTTAPLLVAFPLVMALRREWRWMPLALVPLLLLAGWSAWNMHEYGGIHVLGREGGPRSLRDVTARAAGLLTCLGALAPFSPAFLRALPIGPGRRLFRIWGGLLLLATGLSAAVYLGRIPEHSSDAVLRIAFTLNGVLLAVTSACFLPRDLAPASARTWALVLWAVGLSAFLALFSPMMASRHVLLILPPILLLIAPALEQARARERILAVVSTGLLGVLLTVSDKHYAAFYRDQAPKIAAELGAGGAHTVWSLGHWGWQWYSEKAGMPIYGRHTSQVAVGDILVIPDDYDNQITNPSLRLQALATWSRPPGPATFFSVEQYAGMYTSGFSKLPWSLDRTHIKRITAYRVVALR